MATWRRRPDLIGQVVHPRPRPQKGINNHLNQTAPFVKGRYVRLLNGHRGRVLIQQQGPR